MKKETNQEKLSRLVNADFNDMIQRKLIFIGLSELAVGLNTFD